MLRITRRNVLSGALVLGASLLSKSSRADDAPSVTGAPATGSRIKKITRDSRGTTIEMDLEHAPFPVAGSPYKDPTVIAFVPSHFRLAHDARVSMLVHFHGHTSTAESAMVAHELREQLYDSKQNAILLVPQGPVLAADSACGKIEAQGGLARMIDDALRTLAREQTRSALGITGIDEHARAGTVCVSAHSGGYHAASQCVQKGGVEVTEVYLFDALYAEENVFRDWVIAGRGRAQKARHKLVIYTTGGTTEAEGKKLLADLENHGVKVATETREGTLSREELTLAEVVFIRTSLSHGAVTHELNGLRDCLYASALPRRLRTSWFDSKLDARPLERRRSSH